MRQHYERFREDPVWSKVIKYSLVVFLIRLADSLVSFWAPELIQTSLNNSFYMGLIISFQSIVGLGADLVFPIFLKKGSTKKLTVLAILMSGLTAVCLYISSLRPLIIFFLIAMAVWGIYYELASFSVFEFVDNAANSLKRSGSWAIINIFAGLSYLLGPLIAVFLLAKGNIYLTLFALLLLLISVILFLHRNKMYDRDIEASFDGVKPVVEINYWYSLVKRVWPVILISFFIGIIDSTFWTTGVIWTVRLVQTNYLASFLIPIYQGTTLVVGLFVVRWGIYEGKKKMAIRFLVLSGLFLSALFISDSIFWILFIIFVSSSLLSITIPLIEGTYSDFIARMGTERKHLVGLNGAVVNLSYIIWPPIAGFLTSKYGERMTFVWVGVLVAIFSILLYFIIPKKIKLPQEEISGWED